MISDRERRLDQVVTFSLWETQCASDQAINILNDFNRGIDKSAFCETIFPWRGSWINPGQFLLGARNKRAELAKYNPNYFTGSVWLTKNPMDQTETISVHNTNDLFYGAYGTYVLNVPVGHYAKAWSGTQPKLYGPGPHVIRDPNFRFDKEHGLINLSSTNYIQHETLHIITVPAGYLAKALIGGMPYLLEARDTPYVFSLPNFKLEKTDGHYFVSATHKFIEHGSIKRLLPYSGEVVITHNGGNLQIVHPKADNTPTIINSCSHEVNPEFLSMATQTLYFPSEKVKKMRTDRGASHDEINYAICITSDSFRVGIELLVAYRIINAEKALTKLMSPEGIKEHIEGLATADMANAIQQSSCQQIRSYQTRPFVNSKMIKTDANGKVAQPPASNKMIKTDANGNPLMSLQDMVKEELANELYEDYGVEIMRVSIESMKFIDADLAHIMAEQAKKTAETSQQQATMEQEYLIAQRHAEQAAKVRQIGINQENDALISQATAKFEAAKLDSATKTLSANASRDAALIEGEKYIRNPELLKLELTRMHMEALSRCQFVPPAIAPMITSGLVSSAGFFTQPSVPALPHGNVVELNREQENAQAPAAMRQP